MKHNIAQASCPTTSLAACSFAHSRSIEWSRALQPASSSPTRFRDLSIDPLHHTTQARASQPASDATAAAATSASIDQGRMGLWELLWWGLGFSSALPGATLRLLYNYPITFTVISGVRTTTSLVLPSPHAL